MIQVKAPTQNDGVKFVEIPKGWKRILENGSIHYISPSSNNLNSYEHVIDYLKKDGTCKCGLDCPFHVHRVFNFDTTVQNKEQTDNVFSIESHSSTCKLCDSNWRNEKNLVDSRFLQKPLNQTLKQSGKKPVQFSFDGSLNKKVANRSRAKLSDGPKAKRPRKVSSPLSDIPSPPPIPISSPVQNVPNNLGALNQGPLPSFASIVSSSKFFNPGPNRGPLQPIGSLPLQGNNKFAFPRILTPDISKSTTSSNSAAANTTSIAIACATTPIPTMTKSAVEKAALLKGAMTSTASVTNTVVQKAVSTTLSSVTNTTSRSDKKPVVMETCSSSANSLSTVTSHHNSATVSCSNILPNLVSNTVCLVKTISTPTITSNKAVIMPIINTPTLPSVFAPLDGVSTDVVKSKPPPKAKSRSRPSRPKSSKAKTEVKVDDKSKIMKIAGSTVTMSSASPSRPISSHWPVSASHVPYQTANTSGALSNATSVVSTHSTDSLPLSRPVVPQIAIPSSIYMTANYQNHGQSMKISSPPAVSPLNQNTGSVGSGKDGSTSAPVVTSSSNYSVVASPRIQAPPGMMYVAAAPGVGMFSPAYSYPASAQQLQITQAPVSQQNKTAATTTAATTSSQQQPVTQGIKSETTQGQISFQVPSMYVQGSNQMFPINPQGFGVNQYKAPYQLQNAVYPNTGNTMTFITPNGAKATYPGLQTVGQFAYPNPYMFGIVMPTTTNQQTTSANTPSSPGTPTSVTTSLHMIQPQTLQNPAVAAAFDSFVPIAPAAGGSAPRFAQTLAHLASAYNTFPQAGLVQGGNHLQLAYQMMQMNPHGNIQQIANLGGLGPADAKHPIASSVKQASSDSGKCGGNPKSKAPQSPLSNSQHTPVTQDYAGPSIPSHSSNSLITTTSTSISMSQLQQPLGLCQKPKDNLTTTSVSTSENKNSQIRMPDLKCKDTSSDSLRHESNREWENAIGSPKSNSLCSAINANGPKATDNVASPPLCKTSPSAKLKSLSDVGVSKQDSTLETESVKYQQQAINDNQSTVRTTDEPNTRFSIQSPGQANSHCSRQDFQSHPNSVGTRAVTAQSISPTKTIDNREPKRSPKFVEKVNYYETNPLLGMKRSCEAIEVYPDPPENLADEDKEDYYSPNESPEGNDATSECILDLRHGDSSNVEDTLRPGAQMQNVGKGIHNGGCNAVNNEQDTFLGSRVKSNVDAEPYQPDVYGDLTIANIKPHFDTGDIVWAQARGLPSWPGKIVDENKVGKGKADDGKKWVMWFGDHTFSQVEVDRLKTLNEGLRSLDDKARKKKYRAKKARISLEQAITEALEELEMREQIKSRQGVKSKAKKKRLR